MEGPIRAPKWPHIHPKNNCFLSIFVFVANIRYSTLKMTPLTTFWLQPISYLTGIGISTFPNHQGPHQTFWKVFFSLASLFLWLISGTLPQKWLLNGHMYTAKKHNFLTQSSPFIVETAPSPPSREHLFYHLTCRLIFCAAHKCSVLFVWNSWLGMVFMPILNRYEIGCSHKMVSGVIFGVDYLISATKTKMLGKMVFFGCMCGSFGPDGAPDNREY